jgi:hypothetical protein
MNIILNKISLGVDKSEQSYICEIFYETLKNGNMKPSNVNHNFDVVTN